MYGEGNEYDFGERIYDPRLGKFLSLDPLTRQFCELTPYQFASNSPIAGIDLDGLEFLFYQTTLQDRNGVSYLKVGNVTKVSSPARIHNYTLAGDLYFDVNIEMVGLEYSFVEYNGEYRTLPKGITLTIYPALMILRGMKQALIVNLLKM